MEAVPSEATPLLSATPTSPETDRAATPTSTQRRKVHRWPSRLVWCLMVWSFVTKFSFFHILAPKTRLLELTICRHHYAVHDPSLIVPKPGWPGYDISEEACKITRVQTELSNLKGTSAFLEAICTLVFSVPFGVVADKYGRNLVHRLLITGLLLSNAWILLVCTFYDVFPTVYVLVANAFYILGAGPTVLWTIFNVMGADISTQEERSTTLFWLLASGSAGNIVGTGLSSQTMRIPALPFCISFLGFFISLVIGMLVPRTDRISARRTQPGQSHQDRPQEQSPEGTINAQGKRSWSFWAPNIIRRLNLKNITYKSELITAVLLFFLQSSRGPTFEIVLPYVSKRYHWPIRNVSLLDALNSSIGLLVAIFVLPFFGTLLRTKLQVSPQHSDLVISEFSAAALGLGSIITGLAPTIGVFIPGWILYSAGIGIRPAVLSLVSHLFPVERTAKLYVLLTAAETVGDLVWAPTMWAIWSATLGLQDGVARGGFWFVVAGCFLLEAALLLKFLKAPQKITEDENPN